MEGGGAPKSKSPLLRKLSDFIIRMAPHTAHQIFPPPQLANIFGKPSVTFSYDLHGYDPEVREGYDPIDDSGGARSYSPTPPTPGKFPHGVFELDLF